MTAFLVVLGLAMGALLLMQAAALFVRPDHREARATEAEGASFDARRTSRNTSRSAAGPRSLIHALRAPGLLCEQAFAFSSRHAALRTRASAVHAEGARPRVRSIPASG